MVEFGNEPVPYEPIDNPAVVHGVHDSGTHSYEDFQVTPDGLTLFSTSVRAAFRQFLKSVSLSRVMTCI